ncbi:MAG: ABC transporter permease [Rhizobiaceae bacterium]|nr:ABC transporter permease [Rhizobiaceae bacterium]
MALYLTAVRLHMKSLIRLPAYWVPTLLFPVMFFAMFGAGSSGPAADYRMASFVVYGVISIAFYQFGVSIAQERESHWERYRRTLPGATGPRMASQLISALAFALTTASLVIITAFFLSTPTIGFTSIIALLVAALLVAVPFTFLGIALGYWTTAKSAVAIANLIYLPLAYAGSLWMPPDRLPPAIAEISHFTPTRHAAEIVWAIVGGRTVPNESIAWLIGFSLIFATLAYFGYQRDERQRYA